MTGFWGLFVQLVGTVAFAVSGAMTAIDKRVDLFGVLFLSVITALGGGITRDLLLGRTPPVAFTDYTYITVAALSALLVFVAAAALRRAYCRNEAKIAAVNNVFDALGLGAFSVVGAQVAIASGFGDDGLLVVLSGAVTAIGGGLLRDVLVSEIPFVLKKRIYAVAAIAGALSYYALHTVSTPETLSLVAGAAVTFGLRVLATIFRWDLPKAIP